MKRYLIEGYYDWILDRRESGPLSNLIKITVDGKVLDWDDVLEEREIKEEYRYYNQGKSSYYVKKFSLSITEDTDNDWCWKGKLDDTDVLVEIKSINLLEFLYERRIINPRDVICG